MSIIVKLVRRLKFSFQCEFIWLDVTSKNVVHVSIENLNLKKKFALTNVLSFFPFSEILTIVLIAHVKMAVPVQMVSTVTLATAS